MSALYSMLEDLWQIACGIQGPRPGDTITSIENHCRACLDDQLLGATSQLFGANKRSVPAILRESYTSGIVPRTEGYDAVLKLREELLRFIEWLIEEYTKTRQLPEEQIAEYATEIVKVCILVFRRERDSSKVRELSCLGALRRLNHLPTLPSPRSAL